MNPRAPRLAYLATCFPNPVDTFVRREMHGLRDQGFPLDVVCSLRPGTGTLEPKDPPLLQARSGLRELGKLITWAALHPRFFFRVVALAFELDRKELLVLRQGHSSFLKSLLLLPRVLDLHQRLDGQITQIHAQFAGVATTVACLLAHLRGISFSFTAHGSDLFVYAPFNLRQRLELCTACVTVSKYNRRHLLTTYGEDLDSKIHVVRCGIDTSLYRELRSPGCQVPPQLLTVALLGKVKGIDVFLEALSRYKLRGGAALKYHLVGDGPERVALEQQVMTSGLSDWVQFHGLATESEVRAHLAQADLFVLPSRSEGFPVSLMEAAAAGLPLLASHITGIPEILQEEENGLFLIPDDVEQQAGQLELLMQNNWQLLHQLKQTASELNPDAWDIQTSIRQLVKVFDVEISPLAITRTS